MSSQTQDKRVQRGPSRIRTGINAEGLTVEEFAVGFGVASKTVYRWLNGLSTPRRAHARRLAARFGGIWSDYVDDDRRAAA